MLSTTAYRSGLAGVDSNVTMAGQSFNQMVPVPPHLKYRPEISTYMDHYRRPKLPPPRRQQLSLIPRSAFENRQNGLDNKTERQMYPSKNTVTDYMDEILKKSSSDFPAHQARLNLPFKTAEPNKSQRLHLRRIARSGFGISPKEAREISHHDRSVDFYRQHEANATNLNAKYRVRSAPINNGKAGGSERHWLTWDSGTPEPPGLQKRLHRPWPSPEPQVTSIRDRQLPSRPVSSLSRPGDKNTCIMPVIPTEPVPDMLGSDAIHPYLTRDREECFTPKPPNLAQGDLRKYHYPYTM